MDLTLAVDDYVFVFGSPVFMSKVLSILGQPLRRIGDKRALADDVPPPDASKGGGYKSPAAAQQEHQRHPGASAYQPIVGKPRQVGKPTPGAPLGTRPKIYPSEDGTADETKLAP
jgi:hypothetical protein